jgi:hypothetical protein
MRYKPLDMSQRALSSHLDVAMIVVEITQFTAAFLIIALKISGSLIDK